MLEQILWTALITPFDESGENIDYQSLKQILTLQAKAGNGILLFGSTGEGLSLSDEEKKSILEFVIKLKLDTKILVGVPGINLKHTLEWLNFCKDFPIDGYLIITPIYSRPSVLGQTLWFEKLLHHVHVPVILYNNPSRAGVKLYPEIVKNLSKHEKFIGIKDSSGIVDTVAEYKHIAPRIKIFCGDDQMLAPTASLGATSLISVVANVWPAATRKYVEKCLKGEFIKDNIWWKSCQALFTTTNPIPLKVLMHRFGLIENPTVRLPLSIKDLSDEKILIEAHNNINNWLHNN